MSRPALETGDEKAHNKTMARRDIHYEAALEAFLHWQAVPTMGTSELRRTRITTPGSTPGTTPGSTPGTTPGSTPGTTPGSTPGTTPGSTPGQRPCVAFPPCEALAKQGAKQGFAPAILGRITHDLDSRSAGTPPWPPVRHDPQPDGDDSPCVCAEPVSDRPKSGWQNPDALAGQCLCNPAGSDATNDDTSLSHKDVPLDPIKSFDFVVYPQQGPRLLVDVKGRLGRSSRRGLVNLQNWVTAEDVRSMFQWQALFGPGFVGVFAFLYAFDQQPPDAVFPDVFFHRRRWYGCCAVTAEQYARHMKPRSPRWQTVFLPAQTFAQLVRPLLHLATPHTEKQPA